ncbi:MAG: hypothetical protein GY851_12165, partial [bacterium]|nr:hypothetical protein [bacterium]
SPNVMGGVSAPGGPDPLATDFERSLDLGAYGTGIDQSGPGQQVVLRSTVSSANPTASSNSSTGTYFNTGAIDMHAVNTGVRISGPGNGTFVNNTIVGSSAGSSGATPFFSGGATALTKVTGVDHSGSGRVRFERNIVAGVSASGSINASYTRGSEISATAQAVGIRLGGSGPGVLTNNMIQAASVYVSINSADAGLLEGDVSTRGAVLDGTGDAVFINNTFFSGSVGASIANMPAVDGGIIDERVVSVFDINGTPALLANNIMYVTGDDPNIDTYIVNASGGDVTLINNDIWGATFDCLLHDGTTCVGTANDINACGWDYCNSATTSNIRVSPRGWVKPLAFRRSL